MVTGVPRSGTTWLARLLATARGTSLAGREPMNPREGQYALAGTLTGWARIVEPSAAQHRALLSTYAGRNPRTFGRYGRHQWRAPLPGTRIVVKDPFALLSTPAIVAVTGARPIQVYRHPGAVLASYRRMGWSPDLDEIAPFVPELAESAPDLVATWADGPHADWSEATAMALFWSVLQELALADLPRAPGTVVVGHGHIAQGGPTAAEALFAELGLVATPETHEVMVSGDRPSIATGSQLHQLDRRPDEVADSWRRHLQAAEVAEIESVAGPTLERLDALRLAW